MSQNRRAWFKEQLAKYDRIAVCGVVNGGKTTLCRGVRDRPTVHTDDFRQHTWEDVPHKVIAHVAAMKDPKILVEGIQAPRCLRKGMKVDAVLWLGQELEQNSPGQRSMSKGSRTVLDDWHKDNKHVPIIEAPAIPFTETLDENHDEE